MNPWRETHPRSWAGKVVAFWTEPIRAEPLALFRILIGAIIFTSVLTSVVPTFGRFAGPDGLCPPEAMDQWIEKTGRFCLLRGPKNLPGLDTIVVQRPLEPTVEAARLPGLLPRTYADAWKAWGTTRQANVVFLVVWLAALAGLMVGWQTRFCAVVAWMMAVTFHTRVSWVLNGGDSVSRAALFYLMLAPAGAIWSLDRWRQVRKRPELADRPVFIAPWSVRLMQIQLGMIYFFTGLSKLGEDWVGGEAVYWVLNDVALNRWPYHWLPLPLWACRLASWSTLLWEIGFVFLIGFRRLRPWVLLLGVGFHVGIWATMEVGWFGQVTMCWYALFLSGETLSSVVQRLRTSRWALASDAEASLRISGH